MTAVSRGRVALLLSIVTGACESMHSPSSPLVVPNFAGRWAGAYTITSCDTNIGGPICTSQFKGNPGPYSMTLTLAQTGASVSGTLVLFPCTITIPVPCGGIALTVRGGVDKLGQLALIGSGGVDTRVTDWRTRLADDGLRGTFTIVVDGGQLVETETGEVLGLTRALESASRSVWLDELFDCGT
jgi:hypothetical protein